MTSRSTSSLRFPALLVLVALLVAGVVACSGDDDQVSTRTSTVPVLPAEEFDARVDEICTAAIEQSGQFNPAGAVSTEEAAVAIRGLANVTYEALTELGAVRPEERQEDYQRWLELLLVTAGQMDAGAAALQAGEVNAGIGELNEASATSAQASELGVSLGLERCQFLDPAAANPTTTILGG